MKTNRHIIKKQSSQNANNASKRVIENVLEKPKINMLPIPSILVEFSQNRMTCNKLVEKELNLKSIKQKNIFYNSIYDKYRSNQHSNINLSFEKYEIYADANKITKTANSLKDTFLLFTKNINSDKLLLQFVKICPSLNSNENNDLQNSYNSLFEELKHANEELSGVHKLIEKSDISYVQLFENNPNGIAIYRPIKDSTDFIIVDFNRAAEIITNSNKSEMIGNTFLEKFPNMRQAPLFKVLQNVAKTGKSRHVVPFYYKDSVREGWRENHIYMLPSGEIVTIFSDVTEKMEYVKQVKKQNRELKKALKKVEETENLKTSFLQNLSHEVRTPMNAICGFSNLLRTTTSNEKQLEYIEIINDSASKLLNIITDILTLSSIETGFEKLFYSVFNLNDLIKEIYDTFSDRANKKGLFLHASMGFESQKANIKSDNSKLLKILSYLIDNAIKFAESGSVLFGYKAAEDRLTFYVKDTGIGIDIKYHKVVFDRFRQCGKDTHCLYGGNGLGLTISKAFVQMLGGDIWFSSNIDKGTSFYFSIPHIPENYAIFAERKVFVDKNA